MYLDSTAFKPFPRKKFGVTSKFFLEEQSFKEKHLKISQSNLLLGDALKTKIQWPRLNKMKTDILQNIKEWKDIKYTLIKNHIFTEYMHNC